MKHVKTSLILMMIIVIGISLSVIVYLQWSQYQEKRRNDIETRTNYLMCHHLESVTRQEEFVDFVVGLVDFEYADHFTSLITAEELMNEFIEQINIEPFTYIPKIETYDKYEAIFSKIREVIVKVAFYDKDFSKDTIFYHNEGSPFEIPLGNHRYQYQIQKFVLSKENWKELFQQYQQDHSLKENFYQEKLWESPLIRAILKEENITQDMWYHHFDQLYKKLYPKMEDTIVAILTDFITDFCDDIIEKEQYKKMPLHSLLITYQFQWTNRIPNLSGLGETYQTKLNITEIYDLLDTKKYPKLYF